MPGSIRVSAMSEPALSRSAPPPVLTPNQRAWRRFRAQHRAVAATWFLGFVLVASLIGPWLTGHSANRTGEMQFAAPNATYWCGTDVHGRDLLTRLLIGTRISLLVGAVGASVALVIGVSWGMTAAYLGGRIDNLMMRIVDVLYSLPNILFVMLGLLTLEAFSSKHLNTRAPELVASLHLTALFVLIGAVSWLNMARIVRGQVLSLRTRPFVLASQALGAGHVRILSRQILPNILGIVIVYLSLTVPAVILYESFLSFLGRGIRPPQASLGTLIADGAAQLNPLRIRWWLVGFPAGLLATLMLALTFIGDGLRAALDPKAEP